LSAFETKDMIPLVGEDPGYVTVLGWTGPDEFVFLFRNTVFQFHNKTKSGKIVMEFADGAENTDFHLGKGLMAYTVRNNLYLQAMGEPPRAVTNHHQESAVIAGQAIARQEFGTRKGTFWNPEGTALAFYEKDESEVARYPLMKTDLTSEDSEMVEMIRYPMAGQKNETSRVGVYHLNSGKTIYLNSEKEPDDFMTNLGWTPDGKFLTVAEINRAQDHLKLRLYDARTGELVRLLYEEQNDRWVEPEQPTYFISNLEYLWLSEKDGFMNIYKGRIDQPGITPVTRHRWVVQEIISYDSEKSLVFYHGTGPSALERHAYATSLENGGTRHLTPEPGVHHIVVSKDFETYYDDYSR
jgi:dipeptidyl-peptidase-4